MRTVNGWVAVTPPEKTSVTVQVTNRVARISEKSKLLEARIVFATADGIFQEGDTVYLPADMIKHDLKIMEQDGKSYVLIKDQAIVARG